MSVDLTTVSVVLNAVLTVFSGYLVRFKAKLGQTISVVEKANELLKNVNTVLADDELTPDELMGVRHDLGDLQRELEKLLS